MSCESLTLKCSVNTAMRFTVTFYVILRSAARSVCNIPQIKATLRPVSVGCFFGLPASDPKIAFTNMFRASAMSLFTNEINKISMLPGNECRHLKCKFKIKKTVR
jgi:hypothetical protein